jgi:hypothetical protein
VSSHKQLVKGIITTSSFNSPYRIVRIQLVKCGTVGAFGDIVVYLVVRLLSIDEFATTDAKLSLPFALLCF